MFDMVREKKTRFFFLGLGSCVFYLVYTLHLCNSDITLYNVISVLQRF